MIDVLWYFGEQKPQFRQGLMLEIKKNFSRETADGWN